MVVRIGMIGAGFIARLHATALRSLGPDAAQIVGVAARTEGPREAVRERVRHSGTPMPTTETCWRARTWTPLTSACPTTCTTR